MSHPVEPTDAGTPAAPDPGAVLVDGNESGTGSGPDGSGVDGSGVDANPDMDPDDPVWDDAGTTRDWGWIEEWRESGEDTPWAYGSGLAVFAALLAMVGVIALSDSLSGQPWLAVIINVVVAGGIAPALWLCRGLPVLRWVAVGVAAGLVLGWIGALAVVVPV